jgi:polyisoprenoid-binding protein YceI
MSKTNWVIDPTHSEIGFKVKHMMFTNVSGKFNSFEAQIAYEEADFTTASIQFSADVNSIDTHQADRDLHLRSADFFDVEHFPTLTFESESVEKTGDSSFNIHGVLTLKGVSKKIVLKADYSGLMQDPWGNTKIGLAIQGIINRKDYGLTWNAALEKGGVLVGEDVTLVADVQFIKV